MNKKIYRKYIGGERWITILSDGTPSVAVVIKVRDESGRQGEEMVKAISHDGLIVLPTDGIVRA